MSILKREILYPGKSDASQLEPETKLLYHFETVAVNGSKRTVIDDSRRLAKGEPVETIYGKQFKLPIWESCLGAMRIGEICKLTVRDDPVTHFICLNYVTTSKCFRKHYGVKPTRRGHHDEQGDGDSHGSHNCSMSLRNTPYEDLNQLIGCPPEIFEFTFELVSTVPPTSYTKDLWQMTDNEKLAQLPKYREEGNRLYKESNYLAAVSAYEKGLSAIESLMLKERPNDKDWIKLDQMKLPFLLNLAQVRLSQGEYYECIKITDEAIKRDPKNVKAIFRRARAHAAVWNTYLAREDFKKCLELDKTLNSTITKCIQELKSREEVKNKEECEQFSKIFANHKPR